MERRAASQPRSWTMKSLAGWKTADLYVSVLIHETFISLIRHPAMMFFVGFFFVEKIQTQKPHSPLAQAEGRRWSERPGFQPPNSSPHIQCMFIQSFFFTERSYNCSQASRLRFCRKHLPLMTQVHWRVLSRLLERGWTENRMNQIATKQRNQS